MGPLYMHIYIELGSYIFIYIYIHIYVYIHIHTYICIYICMAPPTHTYPTPPLLCHAATSLLYCRIKRTLDAHTLK